MFTFAWFPWKHRRCLHSHGFRGNTDGVYIRMVSVETQTVFTFAWFPWKRRQCLHSHGFRANADSVYIHTVSVETQTVLHSHGFHGNADSVYIRMVSVQTQTVFTFAWFPWKRRQCLHSYGFRGNADRRAESIHKNGIYSNATEFVNSWMNKRRSVT